MNRVGRNDPCPCGSGKKYKKCCLASDEAAELRESARQPEYYPDDDDLDNRDDFDGGGVSEEEYHDALRTEHARSGAHLFNLWSKEEAEEMTTPAIVEKLASLGIAFDEAAFRRDAERLHSASAISEQWIAALDRHIEGRDGDFPWFSVMVLYDRLCPGIPYGEQIDERIDDGYGLREKDRTAEACDLWLAVWDSIARHLAPGHATIEELDETVNDDCSLAAWCMDLADELAVVGENEPAYAAKRMAFCTQFLELFPKSEEEVVCDMRRAVAECWFDLGEPARGEEAFGNLVTDQPNYLLTYISWGDIYADGPYADFAKAESIYRMAKERGVRDREKLLNQRLAVVAQARRTPPR